MSKGPGHVERRLRDLWRDSPAALFTTTELCQHVYGTPEIEKKHRVSVLRALKRIARRPPPRLWRWRLAKERTDDVWYDYDRYGPKSGAAPAEGKRPGKRR